jgi:hypothetical protein
LEAGRVGAALGAAGGGRVPATFCKKTNKLPSRKYIVTEGAQSYTVRGYVTAEGNFGGGGEGGGGEVPRPFQHPGQHER